MAEYERWAYGEGYTAGKVDGGRVGWRDGYDHGFDSGAQVGAERTLLAIRHALGEETVDRLLAEHLIPDLPEPSDSYRARTTYERPAGREDWAGTDNGARLPTYEPVDDDGLDL